MNEQNTPNREREKREFLFGEEPSGGLLFEEAGAPAPSESEPEKQETLPPMKQPYMPKFTEVSDTYRMAKAQAEEDVPAEPHVEAVKVSAEEETAAEKPADASDPTADEPFEKAETDAVVVKIGAEPVRDGESPDFVFQKRHDAPKEADVRERTLEDEKAELVELIGEYEPHHEEKPMPKQAPKRKEPEPPLPYAEPITIDMDGAAMPEKPSEERSEEEKPPRFPHNEYCDESQKNDFKDRFLDRLMSLRVRFIFTLLLFAATLVGEILFNTGYTVEQFFGETPLPRPEAFLELIAAGCTAALILPEVMKAVKDLIRGKGSLSFLPVGAVLLGAVYYLLFYLSGETGVLYFGSVNALFAVFALMAEDFGLRADFQSFRTLSLPGDKFAAERKLTRSMPRENLALDGAVDELNSETCGVVRTSFVSDFFAHLHAYGENAGFNYLLFALVFGVALLAGVSAGFVTHDFSSGLTVAYVTALFGIPSLTVFSRKFPRFLTERAAFEKHGTAVGESALASFSKTDVFSFNDTEVFGKEGVSLKRMMLFGDSGELTDVLRKTASLFSAIGGRLDGIFSDSSEGKTKASGVVIEPDGIKGKLDGTAVCAGTEAYMKRQGIAIPEETAKEKEAEPDPLARVMYTAENGRVMAKFFIRYAFSETYSALLPGLRREGVVSLVYTRDPNVDADLLRALGVGENEVRLMKLTSLPTEEPPSPERFSSAVVGTEEKTDALFVVLLAVRYGRFQKKLETVSLALTLAGLLAGGILSALFGARLTFALPLVYQAVLTAGFFAVCLSSFRHRV